MPWNLDQCGMINNFCCKIKSLPFLIMATKYFPLNLICIFAPGKHGTQTWILNQEIFIDFFESKKSFPILIHLMEYGKNHVSRYVCTVQLFIYVYVFNVPLKNIKFTDIYLQTMILTKGIHWRVTIIVIVAETIISVITT